MTKPEGWNMSLQEWVELWTDAELLAFFKFLAFRVLSEDQKQEVVNETLEEAARRELKGV